MLARLPRFHRIAWLSVGAALVFSGCSQRKPPADQAKLPEPQASQQFDEQSPVVDEEPQTAPEAPSAEVARLENESPPALDVPTQPDEPAMEEKPSEPEPPAPLPASEAPLPLDNVATADLVMPAVHFTDHHAAMNKVGLGDAFPHIELPDLKGQQRALTELSGSKLTLVVFWNGTQPTGLEELADLARYYQPRFADKGLAIVAINSGDKPQSADELAANARARYPLLSDADGQALAQVATGKLPRTYLLDPTGKILWFDIEYSPTTRRDLAAAIRKTLGD